MATKTKKKKVTFKTWLFSVICAIFRFRYVEISKRIEDQEDEMSDRMINSDDNYFIDVRPTTLRINSGSVNFTTNASIGEDGGDENDSDSEHVKDVNRQKIATIKVAIKPKDVLIELERVPSQWSLQGVDEKIALLKDKISLIHENYQAKRDVSLLLTMLQNRKKYYDKATDGQIFWQYFAKYDITNEAKINILLTKYSLVMEKSDIFIPEFPVDAINAMKEFSEKCKELCDKEPRFYVIATKESFKKNYEKRDPILLAQSPFGFYYHILGAWDEEMLYLPEL
jgi:hypothetical protein